jgi:NAD(P)-dependent dehydrogenase (short-subunit alcohol dehydrogenase family)
VTLHHDFAGRVALVIGGTSGIGLATALGFARAGAAGATSDVRRPTSEIGPASRLPSRARSKHLAGSTSPSSSERARTRGSRGLLRGWAS